MWQDFKDFITIDNLHIFCFWFLIILTVVGLIEIIYQIRNAVRKINIADEYIKHHYCPVKAGKSVFEIVET